MKKYLLYCMAAYMVLQIAVLSFAVFRYYDTLMTGTGYKFLVRQYDPYDPFRGRFVALQVDGLSRWSRDPYATVAVDAQGFAYIYSTSIDKPHAHDVYLKNPDLSRYYMNERLAPEAERLQRELRDGEQMWLLVMVKNGNYVIEGLYLDGVRVEEYITGRG